MFCEPKGQELNTFICKKKKNLIFWHPWDLWNLWERIYIDLNKNSVWTGCVISIIIEEIYSSAVAIPA